MFHIKKRKLEESKTKERKIKDIIRYDKERVEYLVEWDDFTRSWENSLPNDILTKYREKVMSYIS